MRFCCFPLSRQRREKIVWAQRCTSLSTACCKNQDLVLCFALLPSFSAQLANSHVGPWSLGILLLFWYIRWAFGFSFFYIWVKILDISHLIQVFDIEYKYGNFVSNILIFFCIPDRRFSLIGRKIFEPFLSLGPFLLWINIFVSFAYLVCLLWARVIRIVL